MRDTWNIPRRYVGCGRKINIICRFSPAQIYEGGHTSEKRMSLLCVNFETKTSWVVVVISYQLGLRLIQSSIVHSQPSLSMVGLRLFIAALLVSSVAGRSWWSSTHAGHPALDENDHCLSADSGLRYQDYHQSFFA